MYDTIIIGGGPAGYLAAERLGGNGKKILLIENQYLGGTCLNVGCIPTKTLINSAKLYVHAKESEQFGVKAENVSFDWQAIQKRKNEVSGKLRAGIESQLKKTGVEVIRGKGEIISAASGAKPARVRSVKQTGESAEHETKTILISAGSVPAMPPIPGTQDNVLVADSTGLLEIGDVPKRLAVIGGGVIGVECAGLFSAFGSEVTVIEMMDEIIPFMDMELSPIFRRAMKAVNFKLGCKVENITGATVHYTAKGGIPEKTDADIILMAAGRRPLINGWGAYAAGIDAGPHGVAVDDRMQTNIPGIWAAGDVTGKSQLAHSAYRMSEVAVTDILNVLDGKPGAASNRMRYNAVPWAVYGITEAAGVGITEQEAAAKGIAILKASLPMQYSGRFAAENSYSGTGAIKVIANAASRCIMGIHAIGPYAPEFIWGDAAVIEQELQIDDVKELIFPHPTVSELIRDAMWNI